VPLKKPSDFFHKDPEKGINIGEIKVSEENFGNVFDVFNNYKTYLNDFENKLNSITALSEQIELLKVEINNSVNKEDLDKAIFSQLLYVNESITNIQKNVKSINEEKLSEIRADASYLLENVNQFVEVDIPKYKKGFVELELKVDRKVNSLTDFLEESKTSRQEHNEKLDYIEGTLKKNILENVISIQSEVAINELKIKNQNDYIDQLREEFDQQIKQLKSSDIVRRNINGQLGEKIDDVEKIIESSVLGQRLDELEDKYKKISEDAGNPNNVLDKKFVTFDQLQDHYRTFVNRIQQQLSSLGGGGETKFRYLDDINFTGDPASYDGKFLRYNASSESFDFADPEVAFNVGVDGPYTLGQVGIGTTSIEDSPYPGNALLVYGNTRITGILTVGEGSITLDAGSGRIASGETELVNAEGGANYAGTVGVGTLRVGSGNTSVTITTAGIAGTSTIVIDPSPVGVGTTSGTVVIKGDLIVEGSETTIKSQTLEISDKTIGIAYTSGTKLTDSQLDGAGIIIHGSDSNKTLTWSNSNSRMEFNTNLYAPNLSVSNSSTFENNVTIGVGATTAFFSIDTGKVGIGSTQPTATLDVDGTLDVSGISTFQGNVSVGSSISMESETGIVSATSFYGDGSNLTGVASPTTFQNDGSSVGSATTVNFADNIDVTVGGNIATVSVTMNLGDLSNVDVSNIGAGATNFLLVYDPSIPGFKFVSPQSLGINNDYNSDPLIDDYGTYA